MSPVVTTKMPSDIAKYPQGGTVDTGWKSLLRQLIIWGCIPRKYPLEHSQEYLAMLLGNRIICYYSILFIYSFWLCWCSLWDLSSLTRELVRASQVALVVKNPPANTEDMREAGSIPESGRSPGGGHGNPLQYACLESPMGRGNWWATLVSTKSWTWLKRLSTH